MQRVWEWKFASPPAAIWPSMADTARFNEAAAMPKHEIIETPRPDGSVDFAGRRGLDSVAEASGSAKTGSKNAPL